MGYGLFATTLIRKGTLTWVRDDLDQTVGSATEAQVPPMLAELLQKYSYHEPGGRVLCWDHARFVNHSCDANCRSTGFDFEIAVRDIHPDDEITDDYGGLNADAEFECHCGSAQCRKWIRADDITRFADAWDREAGDAFAHAGSVHQPLWPILRERTEVERALRGEIPVPSCRAHALPELR
jgi:hypothetical protein